MTTNFRNKVHTFFKNNDTSEIICNILEHINTDDVGMIDILFMQLTHNGYLRMIMDFFKWYYPNTWEYVISNKDYYNDYQTGKNYGASDIVKRILRLDNIDNSDKMLFKLVTIGGVPIITVGVTTAYLITDVGYFYGINRNKVFVLELPYNVKQLKVVNDSSVSTHAAQVYIANAEDISLYSFNYKSDCVLLKGLDKMTHVHNFYCDAMPSEMLTQLPAKCVNFYYKRCVGGSNPKQYGG